eukprot:TRINITY_DN3585_c7_g1_i1.p1 TRINITY_DN3585_c7_g1~~TRINITY_DN3585_c7_g1_i1.p1  ORF type:complete len:214 (+),score=28.38 TRINITY_DN3585_c7_g1_i1:78-719(+)
MSGEGQITTLHISNLPDDFKERELFLLYIAMEGFQHGQLKFSSPGKTLGFVTFETVEQAAAAMEKTNGLVWNGSTPEFTLRVGFASAQSRVRKTDKSIISNRPNRRVNSSWTGYRSPPSQYPPGPQSLPGSPQQTSGTTLFVGGVDPAMNEQALIHLFTLYNLTKITKNDSKAWICFNTHEEAKYALHRMDGYVGQNQPTPFKVSFAKSDTRR